MKKNETCKETGRYYPCIRQDNWTTDNTFEKFHMLDLGDKYFKEAFINTCKELKKIMP